MEISENELATLRLKGKLKILQESRRILDELYWNNIKKTREILDLEINAENNKTFDCLVEERRKIMDEIRQIDEQLGN